eukprot:2139777-Pleurochrysis_carterae.AAC.1
MRVKVANDAALPVKFIGPIVLRIPQRHLQRGDSARAARRTLCAQPLRYSTLDDSNVPEGRHAHLPQRRTAPCASDRQPVRIRETTANYTITLFTDTFVCAVSGENDTVERARGQVGQFENLLYARLGHFSIDRINASVNHVVALKGSFATLIQAVVLA